VTIVVVVVIVVMMKRLHGPTHHPNYYYYHHGHGKRGTSSIVQQYIAPLLWGIESSSVPQSPRHHHGALWGKRGYVQAESIDGKKQLPQGR